MSARASSTSASAFARLVRLARSPSIRARCERFALRRHGGEPAASPPSVRARCRDVERARDLTALRRRGSDVDEEEPAPRGIDRELGTPGEGFFALGRIAQLGRGELECQPRGPQIGRLAPLSVASRRATRAFEILLNVVEEERAR